MGLCLEAATNRRRWSDRQPIIAFTRQAPKKSSRLYGLTPSPLRAHPSVYMVCFFSLIKHKPGYRPFLTMQGQESKDLRGVEYFVHRDQIVIGVLEANIPCAVVDRLNPAKVEKAGVIGRS